MARTIVLGCAPIVLLWLVVAAAAWCRRGSRRGSLHERWRALSAPAGRGGGAVVDLSADAAARLVAARVGGAVRGLSYLVLVTAVLAEPPLPFSLVLLAVSIWVLNRWHAAAGLVYLRLTRRPSIAYDTSTWAYLFPAHGRARSRSPSLRLPGRAAQTVGIVLLLCAGLPLAYGSDALPTLIPGLSIRHSGLPWWALAAILSLTGCAVAFAGSVIERRARAAAMRATTTLRPAADADGDPIVFLRPFGSESLRVPAHPGARRDGLAQLLPKPSDYLEDVATWMLWSRAQVVAIANPHVRSTPTVGAAHHLVEDPALWRAEVLRLLDRAPAIVLIAGDSAGIAWELEQVMRTPRLAGKTLVVNAEPNQPGGHGFLRALGSTASAPPDAPMVIASAPAPNGRVLLCSTGADDLDVEAAVERFLVEL